MGEGVLDFWIDFIISYVFGMSWNFMKLWLVFDFYRNLWIKINVYRCDSWGKCDSLGKSCGSGNFGRYLSEMVMREWVMLNRVGLLLKIV